MLKKFKIIFFIIFNFISCYFVKAQTDTIDINEVVISSDRVPVLYSETARIVSVISKKEIENAPIQSLQELLEYALNADVRQRGNQGVQADISIRGGSFDQTLILLNGVEINDPQTGHHNLDIPIEIDDIKRIEILEGPGSRIFGPNAFSGAVNIITGSDKNKSVKLSLMGGEHNFYNASLSGSYKVGKMNNYISLTKKISDGYIENTDFNISNLFYQTSYSPKQAKIEKIDVQVAYMDKDFGANSFYTPVYPNQFEHTKTTFANIRVSTKGKIRFTPNIYWRRHQDRFELFRDNPQSWYAGHNYHLTDVYGTDFNANFSSKFGKTAFGSAYRSENILSNTLGKPMYDTLSVPGEPNGKFTHKASRENIGVFIDHSVFLKKISFSMGLLANWYQGTNINWNIYPGFDISYKLTKKIKLFASVNKSLRLPTFTDLYYKGPCNLGNDSLKPEESVSYETGTKYVNNFLFAHISVFRRYGKNIIDWVKQPDSSLFESKNITELVTNGFEISVNINTKKLFNNSFPFKYINISYSYTDKEKQSNVDYISNYALDYLKHKLIFATEHRIYKDISASWRFNFQDRAGTYTDFILDKEVEYKPFCLVDTRIFWKRKYLNIYLEASNLLDVKYYDIGNIEMPGTWICGGISINLDFDKTK